MEICMISVITVLVLGIMAWHCIKWSTGSTTAPVNWPIVGMMPSLLWHIGDIYEYAANLVLDNGGTFRFRGPIMAKDLFEVVTCTPANLEHILKNKFPNFPRGPHFKGVFFSIFGDGLFTADEELWTHQRKAVGATLRSSSFRDRNANLLQKLIQEKLFPVLEHAKENKSFLDLQDVFLRFNFDSICITVLGKDPGCLTPSLPEVPFATAFDEAVRACTYRLILPTFLWKLMRLLNVGFERNLSRSATIIHKYVSDMVKAKIKEIKDMGCVLQGDILSNFIKMEAEEGRYPSEKLLQDLLLSIFLAGVETSALCLSWFFWLLNMHPRVEDKILCELCRVPHYLKKEDKYFTVEEVKGLNYLQASLSEALRLYPPVPLSYRQAVKDNILPDGTFVKKGSKILYLIYATNRMEEVWGNDARQFRPERWINKDGEYTKESDYKYPVFNGGPRLCLGRDIAYTNMKCVVANILARYMVKVDPGHPVKPMFGLSLSMKHGLKIALETRKVNDM